MYNTRHYESTLQQGFRYRVLLAAKSRRNHRQRASGQRGKESWSQQLDNKLHSVKPVIGAWPVMPLRRTDVKIDSSSHWPYSLHTQAFVVWRTFNILTNVWRSIANFGSCAIKPNSLTQLASPTTAVSIVVIRPSTLMVRNVQITCGCGVVIEDIMHGYRLDTSCSIFTAEAVAIYRALSVQSTPLCPVNSRI
ncbi:hypothetical protein TNCV_2083561 [Trichonephila clavipes]|nr:hypothetical protein TNCV_2083561 [Trichonephila clavipes]